MTSMARPKISILIVTYNSSAVIRECLEGVVGRSDHEVVVVDNCSTDDTVRILSEEFPLVRLIQNTENAGFSRAVNKAAECSRGVHLLLLNPDALITSDVVEQLGIVLDRDESIGIISPLLEHDGADILVIAAGRAPTIWRMLLHQTGLSRFGTQIERLEGNYLFRTDFDDTPKNVDWLSGGCLMVSSSTWKSVGGLTDRWFMYAEDVEFCLRVRASGRRVVVDPRLKATHAVGGSSSNVDGRVNTMWITNLYDLYSWRIAPTSLHSLVWKFTMLSGMLGREMVYRIKTLTSAHGKQEARANVRRYVIYRRALQEAKAGSSREPFIRFGPI
jgi:N-acetylglucosaminyl-diphospho-decaprenol L-rhamnosyltransferase